MRPARWVAEAGHAPKMTRTRKQTKEVAQREVKEMIGSAFQLPEVHDVANGPLARTANRADEPQCAPKELVTSKPPVTANSLEADSGIVSDAKAHDIQSIDC